ncbi:hypothetical protein COO60DRAFT_1532561, partial [Scenedesmus sp. NREL 46B-D3]
MCRLVCCWAPGGALLVRNSNGLKLQAGCTVHFVNDALLLRCWQPAHGSCALLGVLLGLADYQVQFAKLATLPSQCGTVTTAAGTTSG